MEHTLAAAAERLHVSRPSVSRQVRELEAELGVELFVRDRRQVRMTDGGRLQLFKARTVLEEIRAIPETINPANHALMGTLNLGVDIGLAKRIQSVMRK